eukprot:1169357-Amphidinium_carterae.1
MLEHRLNIAASAGWSGSELQVMHCAMGIHQIGVALGSVSDAHLQEAWDIVEDLGFWPRLPLDVNTLHPGLGVTEQFPPSNCVPKPAIVTRQLALSGLGEPGFRAQRCEASVVEGSKGGMMCLQVQH